MASSMDEPKREMTLGEQLQDHIRKTDAQIKYLGATEAKAIAPGGPGYPAIAEITLARRHIEDANSRLKRAYNVLPEEAK